MSKKIIVTGANGQLGSCLRDLAGKYPGYNFTFTDIEELDITNSKAVAQFFDSEQPAWIINAAAYTAVDKAEEELEKARLLNDAAVGNLAAESGRLGAGLVHISTDYVFEGTNPSPLTEDEPVNPQSAYGFTKAGGEKRAARNPRHIIIRTSWLYSIYGANFVKTMRRLGSERNEIGVVSDQWGSPTSGDDLAIAVMTAITKIDSADSENREELYGTYHFSNEGATCWADFAEQIMDLSGLECRIRHITTDEFPTAAKRSAFSIMSKSKFRDTFGVIIPEWEASLEEVIERLSAN